MHVVDYDPSDVVELRSALGFQLSVEFDLAEKIVTDAAPLTAGTPDIDYAILRVPRR